MSKKTFFYIDDVIWVFRDLTRQRPKSLFDNPFLKVLKTAHDNYGLKVQLNIFYRTDFFYGNDEFTLKDMTDEYKCEWKEASDWLRLGFHAKQEFPDYPYVNADYNDVKNNFEAVRNEVIRFAGEATFSYSVVPHWNPISKEGCRALKDGGIKVMSVSHGDRTEYNGDPFSLPYGHAWRLLQNRKPETMIYHRGTKDVAIDNSLCGYNHLSNEEVNSISNTLNAIYNDEIGIYFKRFCNGPCINLYKIDELDDALAPLLDFEYVGYGLHEQYFYPDYYAYQEDYADKIYKCAKTLYNNGFEYIFIDKIF